MICVFLLILKQSSISIAFLDWESTELSKPLDSEGESFPKKENEVDKMEEEKMRDIAEAVKSKVSIWRTLLVANEFNEL